MARSDGRENKAAIDWVVAAFHAMALWNFMP